MLEEENRERNGWRRFVWKLAVNMECLTELMMSTMIITHVSVTFLCWPTRQRRLWEHLF